MTEQIASYNRWSNDDSDSSLPTIIGYHDDDDESMA